MIKKSKREIVIVIPGPRYIKSRIKPIQRFIVSSYRLLNNREPIYYNYAQSYAHKLRNINRNAIWLHWGRNVFPMSRWLAVRKLRRLIKKYKGNHKIIIVGISMGGEIALEALKNVDEKSINKLFLICPVIENTNHKPRKLKTISFFSKADEFAKISAKVLSPVEGGIKMIGKNIKNINIPRFGHDSFCADKTISFGKNKGKKVSDIILEFLDER